ncbi:hypothetical protein MG293_020827 [Ovis ammon polii]|uniref:Uncharacterized protein n=1 Tax=Ovis ammon polii TaxID=230172 RepID=A0AAD4XZJ2_OVIAM|nr:hypothetical protein MG293_020827 [Ovis ammon polii]
MSYPRKLKTEAELNETDTFDPEDDDEIQFKDFAALLKFVSFIAKLENGKDTFKMIVLKILLKQPSVVTPGEEATLFMVASGKDREAQVDVVVAGTRRMFQLLPEDIIEDVEVVADEEQQQGSSQELEEKTVEEQSQERPGGPSELLALDVLQALAPRKWN